MKNLINGKYGEVVWGGDTLSAIAPHRDLNKGGSLEDIISQNRKNIEHSQKPADMSDEDWAEANMLFSKGIDNLAVGAYAGFNKAGARGFKGVC